MMRVIPVLVVGAIALTAWTALHVLERYWFFTILTFVFMYFSILFILVFRRHTKSDPLPGIFPTVSVIIPAFNVSHTIERCISHVKAMTYPRPVQILVIDDSSTDDTYRKIKNMSGITVIRRRGARGKGSALNEALRHVKGSLVVNIDADTFPEPDALMKMVGYFNDEKVGAVTTLICVDRPRNILERIQEIEYYVAFGFWHKALSFLDSLLVTPGPMSMYRTTALTAVGGFDEENITEDMEVALHLQEKGYKIKCCTNTKVYTVVPSTLRSYFRQRVRWYRGKIFNGRKYKHMLFNRRYGVFGRFVYPATFFNEFLGVGLLFGVVLLYAESAVHALTTALLSLYHSALYIDLSRIFAFDILALSPSYLILLEVVLIWAYVTRTSFGLAGERMKWHTPLYFIFYIAVYPFMITGAYFVSLFKELNHSRAHW